MSRGVPLRGGVAVRPGWVFQLIQANYYPPQPLQGGELSPALEPVRLLADAEAKK